MTSRKYASESKTPRARHAAHAEIIVSFSLNMQISDVLVDVAVASLSKVLDKLKDRGSL